MQRHHVSTIYNLSQYQFTFVELSVFNILTKTVTLTNAMSLCSRALRVEEQCLANNLADCPAYVVSDLKASLMAFFPAEKCNIRVVPYSNKQVLLFNPERH